MKIFIIYFIIINATAFLLYGIDKQKAKKNKWRTPEATLMLVAVLGGSIGAYAAMKIFHHKTRKLKFSFGLPAIICIQIILLLYFLFKMKGFQTPF